MPHPGSVRKSDLEWRRELLEKRATGRSLGISGISGATLHDLYTQLNKRRMARQRQARLVCCGLLPSVLALVLHLNW